MNKRNLARHRSITIMILCLAMVFVMATPGFAQIVEIDPGEPIYPIPGLTDDGSKVFVSIENTSTATWYLLKGNAIVAIPPGDNHRSQLEGIEESRYIPGKTVTVSTYSFMLDGNFGLCNYEAEHSSQGWSTFSHLVDGFGMCPGISVSSTFSGTFLTVRN